MKKISLFSFLLFIFFFFFGHAHAANFTDINNVPAQYQTLVNNLKDKGIITGLPDGSFSPNKSLTRAEFIAMLVRANGWTNDGTSANFSDSKPGDWHYSPLLIAYQKGVLQGTGSTGSIKMNPNGTVTRLEMMVILSRVYSDFQLVEPTDSYECNVILNHYTDGWQIPDWGQQEVCDAVFNGITQGTGPNTLSSTSTGTRLQSAIFTDRTLGSKENPLTIADFQLDGTYSYYGQVNSNGEPHGIGSIYITATDWLWAYGAFKNGNFNGVVTTWHPNDFVQFEGFYQNGVKQGYGIEYDDQGNVLYDGFWSNGSLVH